MAFMEIKLIKSWLKNYDLRKLKLGIIYIVNKKFSFWKKKL